tara:strand:- start:262 stop:567 length:306 start_codon:yes stop_codon:yes gene_type:complete
MLISLTEVALMSSKNISNEKQKYTFRKIMINPDQVVCIREDESLSRTYKSHRDLFPEDLDSRANFTKIHLNRGQSGIDLVVLGDLSQITEMIAQKKKLLRG